MYIVLAGAGRAGAQLTAQLTQSQHDIVVIDIDESTCEDVYAQTGALVVNGSATDISVLKEAGIERADVALALMRNDADNLAFCLLAKQFGVPRIMGRARNPIYREAYEIAGATEVVEVTSLVVHQLFMAIEQPRIRRLASLDEGQAEVVLLSIPSNALVAGQTVQEIAQDNAFPKDCVFAGIYRPEQDDFIMPRGGERILGGDQVFLAAAAPDITEASDYLLRE
jgi:trk system potassium uptake protein TrkA